MYPRVASFKSAAALREYLAAERITLELDDRLDPPASSPLARPVETPAGRIGNRFCILPMEGWDGTREGEPTDLTRRRWRHFGISGAKLIWGCEAVAVREDGRANPNQLLLTERTVGAVAHLREDMIAAHAERFGSTDDLCVGLQLTHSGRFARPTESARAEPLAACANPVLDRRFPAGVRIIEDEDLDRLVEIFVHAAALAWRAGFRFVDLKQCHGYLGHELLGARGRPGRYGGPLENRLRFLRTIVEGVRAETPGLEIAVRLSVFDTVPYRKSEQRTGVPETTPEEYPAGFGVMTGEDLGSALDDSRFVLRTLQELGIRLICSTAGSPYYNPHIQRPALFPPSDGYEPPEDPLHGVARQIRATAILKREFPGLIFVGSGYTYLQEWLPHVAQFNVRHGLTDLVGLGRMVLAYPELPSDILSGRPLRRKSLCRTFSDCTTGPRLGLVSGCYPLDGFYESHPDGARLRAAKQKMRDVDARTGTRVK
jgi:2,4-dienoyl-CoA reductase-like NADH-dependent reductase (Old Yellow Enzyme family)